MENLNKLERLTKKLLVNSTEKNQTFQQVFDEFSSVFAENWEYFSHINKKDLLKVVFYAFSYKKTGSFDFAKSKIQDLFVASIFTKDDDEVRETCEYCDGNGYTDCDDCYNGHNTCQECDGEGKIDCTTCDGTTKEDCPECNGSGSYDDGETCETCDGDGEINCENCVNGMVECDECDGEGEVTCRNCDGEGNLTCNDCDGYGDVVTDKNEYTAYTIFSYKRDLYDLLELKTDTMEPVSEDITDLVSPSSEKSIIIGITTGEEEFESDGESDVFYCFDIISFEELNISTVKTKNKVSFYDDDDDMGHYTV